MGPAISVGSQKVEKYEFDQIQKKLVLATTRFEPGTCRTIANCFATELLAQARKKNFRLRCRLSCGGDEDPPWHKISWEIPGTR